MNGNYFALYVYTVVYGRGLCLQVMQKLVDIEGLAKMFDESGVVEMVEVYPVRDQGCIFWWEHANSQTIKFIEGYGKQVVELER